MTSRSPEIAAARERVAALLERLRRINLQVVVVAPPDATRLAARDRARAAAFAAGRAELFDEAAAAARDGVLRAFASGGFSGTWAVTDWSISVANADDRAAAAAAFEEAAMAAVVEDLVDEDTLEDLLATTSELERSTGMPSPGALSALTGRLTGGANGPRSVVLLVLLVLAGAYLAGIFGSTVGLLVFAVGMAARTLIGRRSGTDA
jgi:hypothetical protein